MTDPTLPKRGWTPEGTVAQMVLDKNGVNRVVHRNPNAKQEDHQRYVTQKQAESGYTDTSGATPQPQGAPSTAIPGEPAATANATNAPDWMIGLQQKYAADLPLRTSLDKNAPVVSPEMLSPTDEQLAQMDPETREGLGRVFLTLVSKYFGDDSLQNSVLYGTKIRGYLPAKYMQYFNRLVGRV